MLLKKTETGYDGELYYSFWRLLDNCYLFYRLYGDPQASTICDGTADLDRMVICHVLAARYWRWMRCCGVLSFGQIVFIIPFFPIA